MCYHLLTGSALPGWRPLRRLLGPAGVIAAVLFCTTGPLIPGSARLARDESKSPLQQEEEREAEKECREFVAGGQQRLKSDRASRREDSTPRTTARNRRLLPCAGCHRGHRLPNGLCAPLVC